MTISEKIIQWLYLYGNIDIDTSIDTDQLAASAIAYALYKTPSTLVKPYVNGSEDVTEYYNFLVRQPSQLESSRINSQQWLKGLEDWIREQCRMRNLPPIDGCYFVAVSNSFYAQMQNEKEAVYQITIEVKYERK